MSENTCPFLGFKDDPSSALPYPSKENVCHHAAPIQPARGTYQYQYCLTPEHTTCPLFQSATPIPMPDALATPFTTATTRRRLVALLGIPILLALIASLSFVWKAYGYRIFSSGSIPGTGEITTSNNSLLISRTLNSPSLNTLVLTSGPTRVNCPLPAGWTSYTVNQTDSIFRLSAVYAIPINKLQSVNCMGNSTILLPGQVIYVPIAPTAVAPIDLAIIPTQGDTLPQAGLTPTLTQILPTFQPSVFGPPTPAPQPQPRSPTNTVPPIYIIPIPPALATNTNTPVPLPTNTLSPSQTPVTPSNTPIPANTATQAPTRTLRPTRTTRPTDTPVPTSTSIPATNTPILPTDTPIPPPTDTQAPPPSDTPIPAPSATNPPAILPPTNSPPPTDVPPTPTL